MSVACCFDRRASKAASAPAPTLTENRARALTEVADGAAGVQKKNGARLARQRRAHATRGGRFHQATCLRGTAAVSKPNQRLRLKKELQQQTATALENACYRCVTYLPSARTNPYRAVVAAPPPQLVGDFPTAREAALAVATHFGKEAAQEKARSKAMAQATAQAQPERKAAAQAKAQATANWARMTLGMR